MTIEGIDVGKVKNVPFSALKTLGSIQMGIGGICICVGLVDSLMFIFFEDKFLSNPSVKNTDAYQKVDTLITENIHTSLVWGLGAPSEPYNVSIDDITSEGFTLFFTPEYNGGYPQTFTLVLWPVNRRSDSGRITVSSNTIHVRYLTSETNYSLLLYAENEIGRSVESHIGPWFAKTKVGVGDGSHSLIHIIYGTGALCVASLVMCFAIAILTCSRRRKTAIAIKIPPLLAVFRKSRALPDANVLSDVHDAVSRSSSNVTNGNANRQTEDQVQLSSSSTRELNYPHIEIRNSERSPAPIPRRQRTNYSQIDFDARVPTVVEDDSNDGSRSDYGKIFFESTTMPPPASSDDYMNV